MIQKSIRQSTLARRDSNAATPRWWVRWRGHCSTLTLALADFVGSATLCALMVTGFVFLLELLNHSPELAETNSKSFSTAGNCDLATGSSFPPTRLLLDTSIEARSSDPFQPLLTAVSKLPTTNCFDDTNLVRRGSAVTPMCANNLNYNLLVAKLRSGAIGYDEGVLRRNAGMQIFVAISIHKR